MSCTAGLVTTPVPVRVVDDRQIAKDRLVLEALLSHPTLRTCPANVGLAQKALCANVDENFLILFIVFTHRATSIGRYALTHNEIVDRTVQAGDYNGLLVEAGKGFDAIPEVDINHELSHDDKAIIIKSIQFDYNSVHNTIHNYRDSTNGDDDYLIACPTDLTITKHEYEGGEKALHATLYSQCRESVCIANNEGPIKPTCGSDTVRLSEIPRGAVTPEVYCFNLEELLTHLAHNDGPIVTNYLSGAPFNERSLSHLRGRYAKEIAIYRYKLKSTANHNK